ncbi:uncharacterized protein LOC135154504 [Lytechinus pictus]|uniref:uncharacterized protein LOC135154504 n=1 Tax=Lytechinus pictus TaxID=7653 RepID=UPI0030BA0ADB
MPCSKSRRRQKFEDEVDSMCEEESKQAGGRAVCSSRLPDCQRSYKGTNCLAAIHPWFAGPALTIGMREPASLGEAQDLALLPTPPGSLSECVLWESGKLIETGSSGKIPVSHPAKEITDIKVTQSNTNGLSAHVQAAVNGVRASLLIDTGAASGYWQVEVKEGDNHKTAFRTRSGLHEYNVMPFGLSNAPSTFERCMELVLKGLQWKTLLIYLDDVRIFSPTFEDHISRLDEVFQRLSKAGLKPKPSKCALFQSEVLYLGHIVTPNGVKANPDKIAAVAEWSSPSPCL